jgi:hypothetical protein
LNPVAFDLADTEGWVVVECGQLSLRLPRNFKKHLMRLSSAEPIRRSLLSATIFSTGQAKSFVFAKL